MFEGHFDAGLWWSVNLNVSSFLDVSVSFYTGVYVSVSVCFIPLLVVNLQEQSCELLITITITLNV